MLNKNVIITYRAGVGKDLENAGIDPATSRMLSERSTIWANSPSCTLHLVCKYWTQVRNSTSLSFNASIELNISTKLYSTVHLLTEHKIRHHIIVIVIIVSQYNNSLYLSGIQSENLSYLRDHIMNRKGSELRSGSNKVRLFEFKYSRQSY